ncbi:hypothetical protein [Leptospira haakeii]|uniref:Uncharacterized protein n=1 Tax=Leptospira haakeii TaxID=2023198 RepID=A0ABX4PMV3_9LEPT|nr:hypothetical protein [Leptospira haakeii]PKA15364.1 hypothetical protein CH363_14195 [Leptospira haakeii]PKA18807.1 hypothetical protein CH377_15660 [Leptospira haakeii]
MEETRIYNYYFQFSEFQSYLEGRKFQGEGIQFDSGSPQGSNKPPILFAFLDPKKGFVLQLRSGKNLERICNDWTDSAWERKEDLFVWNVNPTEQIYFQALDRDRIHIHWKSSTDIIFSGTIEVRVKSFFQKILGPFSRN